MVDLVKTHVFKKLLMCPFNILRSINLSLFAFCVYPCPWSVSLQSSGRKNGTTKQVFGRFNTSLRFFGNHLDSPRRTVGVDLEKNNSERAEKVLAEVWNELVIDNCSVTCEYVEKLPIKPVAYEEQWVTKDCPVSQYFLQIVKCTNEKCCDPFRTNFPGQLLPATVQFRQNSGGPAVLLGPQAKSTDYFSDLWKCIAIYKLVPQNNYEVQPYKIYYRV